MNDIVRTRIQIEKRVFQELGAKGAHEIVLRKVLNGMSQEIDKRMSIEKKEARQIDAVEYHTEVAILSVDEYKRLKAIEIEYRRVEEYRYDYTVAEEPKYGVINNKNEFLLVKDIEKGVISYLQDYRKAERLLPNLESFKLTEQEIKDYDPRYWDFAKSVKEIGKC